MSDVNPKPPGPTGDASAAAPSPLFAETLFRIAMEQSPLSTMVFSPDGRPLLVNRAYEELFGIRLRQLEGWNILRDEQLEELGVRQFIERGFAGEPTVIPPSLFDRSQSVPGVAYREDPRIWVRAFVYPLKDGDEIRAVVIVHDDITHGKLAEEAERKAREELERRVEERTAELERANAALQSEVAERKRAEEALQQAKEEAERANRAKSDFLSRMSHELRTPLNSILGFAQVLARKATAENERRSLEHILKAGRHLLDLINEVLDISRIEANRLQLSPEPVRTSHVLQETLNLIQHLAAQRGTEIRDEVTRACDTHVRADRQRLTQVLLNLVSNAVKYSPEGSLVRVSCEKAEGDRLRIKVTDAGPGIAPEKVERLFSPFERLGAEHTGVEGTGLGLALSKGLVEAMGGTMGVESAEGSGSTFWLELPLVESPRERLARTREDVSGLVDNLPGGRLVTLLYVEDNLANLSLIETILEDRADIKLLSALQGRVGLELAREHMPDCVLLDLHLPDLYGGEVLEQLRADPRTRDIPVVVISADATPGQIKKIKAAGARAYLTKPLDVGLFLSTLEEVLRAEDA